MKCLCSSGLGDVEGWCMPCRMAVSSNYLTKCWNKRTVIAPPVCKVEFVLMCTIAASLLFCSYDAVVIMLRHLFGGKIHGVGDCWSNVGAVA